jgi:hypothetical protein
MRIGVHVGLATAGLFSTGALAQTAAERAACMGDFRKLSSGVKPRGGRVLTCLSGHKADLTPDCRKVVDAHSK